MTRISFLLIAFILFSCGQKSVANDSVESIGTTEAPETVIELGYLQ